MNMSDRDLRKSFLFWRKNYAHLEVDHLLEPFLKISASEWGWLSKARKALFLSTESMAKELGISRSAYSKLERKELAGEITLRKIQEAAEAMNCELVYCLRSRARKLYSEVIWESLYPIAALSHWVQNRPDFRKSAALSYVSAQLMKDSDFRKKQGWSERL